MNCRLLRYARNDGAYRVAPVTSERSEAISNSYNLTVLPLQRVRETMAKSDTLFINHSRTPLCFGEGQGAGLLSSVNLRLLRYARNDGCDAEVPSLRGS
jgi:hypothetical protein